MDYYCSMKIRSASISFRIMLPIYHICGTTPNGILWALLLETQNEESSKDGDGSTENKDGDTSD